MATASLVLTDDSRLSRWDRALLRLERFLALISGVSVFSLMVLAVVSVSGRNFFNAPLPGYVDWIEQAMPLIAFMGVSYVMRRGRAHSHGYCRGTPWRAYALSGGVDHDAGGFVSDGSAPMGVLGAFSAEF